MHFVPSEIIVTEDFIQLLALIQWVCPLKKLEREHFYTSTIEKVLNLTVAVWWQVLGVIRAMHTIDFASVCFWRGQIAAEKCLCYTKCRCTVSLLN